MYPLPLGENLIIVAFLQNTTIEYPSESVCASMCVSLCVFPCVCVCVCAHARACVCVVVYENSSDEFNIEHNRVKVKVTVGLQKLPHLPQYQLLGPLTQLSHKLGSLY